jgi:hypothetical protein
MNPIVRLAATALPGDRKFILFAGAGLSKDAGIPTAWDLMLKTAGLLYASENQSVDTSIDLQEWFIKSKYSQMTYAELIGQIYPNHPDQQQFLKEYLTRHKTGEVHLLVAELARRGIIRAIVTTNFDHFLEKALEEKGLEPQVISTEEDLLHSEPLIHCKAVRIYKPHGTLGHGALRNTPKDLEALAPTMHTELSQILSEHGVMILGYSGQDKGIQQVLENRSSNYYPLFWIDPNILEGDAKAIIDRKGFTFIQCEGAGQFIRDFLRLIDRLESLAPKTGKGPSVPDLQYEIKQAQQPIGPIFLDFLTNFLSDVEATKPDFSKHADYDDAIVNQIVSGLPLSYRFTEASLVAAKAKNADALRTLYRFFGSMLKLYETPDGFSGTYHRTDFDGFKFLGYEMFVCLIAAILRYDLWALLGELLDEDLFVEKANDGKYRSFVHVSSFVGSLDEIRNNRLKLQRVSVMADMLKDRFTNSELSELISLKEFLEADYFLFMRTVCHEQVDQSLYDVWCPRSSVFLDNAPSYVVKAESARFLERMLPATGFSKQEEFINNLKAKHAVFNRYFSSGLINSPLQWFDLGKLGSRK